MTNGTVDTERECAASPKPDRISAGFFDNSQHFAGQILTVLRKLCGIDCARATGQNREGAA
jgi:hypothetical protein